METFQLRVISCNRILYSAKARYCGITTPSGSMGFEARHEGFLGILTPGSTVDITTESGKEKKIPVSRGTLLFERNLCTITMTPQDS